MPRTLYIMTVVIVGLTIPAVAHLLRELRVEKCVQQFSMERG